MFFTHLAYLSPFALPGTSEYGKLVSLLSVSIHAEPGVSVKQVKIVYAQHDSDDASVSLVSTSYNDLPNNVLRKNIPFEVMPYTWVQRTDEFVVVPMNHIQQPVNMMPAFVEYYVTEPATTPQPKFYIMPEFL